MDVVYLYKKTTAEEFEIRYSLRSVARFAPYIRKVWIFGDRPHFLTDDKTLIEHIPHEDIAPLFGFKTPVENFFLMIFLSSLIPDLSFEYLRFSDDFFLLKDFPIEQARKDRYIENLSIVPTRKRGMWANTLWQTYDILERLGYMGFNFESHVPLYLTRKRVLDAYRDFRHFVSEDRWYGMLGATAILNHAHKHEGLDLACLRDENSKAGFYSMPPLYNDVAKACQGKQFFNFDEQAFAEGIRQFLTESFPAPSKFENAPSAL